MLETTVLAPGTAESTRESTVSSREAFQCRIREFVADHVAMWRDCSAATPLPGRRRDSRERRENERAVDLFVEYMQEELENFPQSAAERAAWRARVQAAAERLGKSILGFRDSYFNMLFSEDYIESTRAFLRAARRFDPCVRADDLMQALRNVWIMNSITVMYWPWRRHEMGHRRPAALTSKAKRILVMLCITH